MNQADIQPQLKTEVLFHVPVRLKTMRNRAIKYLQQLRDPLQKVREPFTTQVLVHQAVRHHQEATLQAVRRNRAVLLRIVHPLREAAQEVHILQVAAVVVVVILVAAVRVVAVVEAVPVVLQVGEGNIINI